MGNSFFWGQAIAVLALFVCLWVRHQRDPWAFSIEGPRIAIVGGGAILMMAILNFIVTM